MAVALRLTGKVFEVAKGMDMHRYGESMCAAPDSCPFIFKATERARDNATILAELATDPKVDKGFENGAGGRGYRP
ncbi:hypothetical protein CKAH01_17718 [Colletotrichum kahawae]|uniref:Uncharacterized protein n=1 Tax=Colletotrichum kahawae TaxID=34407 RepID=A0AAD9Y8H8_COLKA|nr:hypothetical protein CKAH01_17718 [Colletotrichum kahawae]